jgi:hypothetical protein
MLVRPSSAVYIFILECADLSLPVVLLLAYQQVQMCWPAIPHLHLPSFVVRACKMTHA